MEDSDRMILLFRSFSFPRTGTFLLLRFGCYSMLCAHNALFPAFPPDPAGFSIELLARNLQGLFFGSICEPLGQFYFTSCTAKHPQS